MTILALPMEIQDTSDRWVAEMGPYKQYDAWRNARLGITIRRVSHPTARYPYFIEGHRGTYAHLNDAKWAAQHEVKP